MWREALHHVLDNAKLLLENGQQAVAVVRSAVWIMESIELFNAGRGSVLSADGSVYMSAAIMRGSDRAAGAVAGIRRTKHPIIAANAVFDSDQVMLVGDHADRRAAVMGAEQAPNSFFITERQRGRLGELFGKRDHGTVGAVCLDVAGGLAAATSTGGTRGQPVGRVGDSAVIGAGTWADPNVAVACTGDGEALLRAGTARYLATLVAQGIAIAAAADAVLSDVAELGGSGGLIALDADGNAAMPFLTDTMPRGIWRAGHKPGVWIGRRSLSDH